PAAAGAPAAARSPVAGAADGAATAAGDAPEGAGASAERWQAEVSLMICKQMCVLGDFEFGGTWPPQVPETPVDLAKEPFNGRFLPLTKEEAGVEARLEGESLMLTGPARGCERVAFIPAATPGLRLAGAAAESGIVQGSVREGTFHLRVELERTPIDEQG